VQVREVQVGRGHECCVLYAIFQDEEATHDTVVGGFNYDSGAVEDLSVVYPARSRAASGVRAACAAPSRAASATASRALDSPGARSCSGASARVPLISSTAFTPARRLDATASVRAARRRLAAAAFSDAVVRHAFLAQTD